VQLLCAAILLSPQATSPAAEAKAIFAQSEAKLKAAKSLEGANVATTGKWTETFLLAKPGSFRVENPRVKMICNGVTQWSLMLASKEYFKRDVRKTGGFGPPASLDGFYGKPTGSSAPYYVKSTTFEMRKSGGKRLAAKTLIFDSYDRKDSMTFLVDAATKLPVGWDQNFGGQRMSFRFKRLVLGAKVPAGAFTWKPPSGWKEKVPGRS